MCIRPLSTARNSGHQKNRKQIFMQCVVFGREGDYCGRAENCPPGHRDRLSAMTVDCSGRRVERSAVADVPDPLDLDVRDRSPGDLSDLGDVWCLNLLRWAGPGAGLRFGVSRRARVELIAIRLEAGRAPSYPDSRVSDFLRARRSGAEIPTGPAWIVHAPFVLIVPFAS